MMVSFRLSLLGHLNIFVGGVNKGLCIAKPRVIAPDITRHFAQNHV